MIRKLLSVVTAMGVLCAGALLTTQAAAQSTGERTKKCLLDNLSDDVTRRLTNLDRVAIRAAADAKRDITGCDVSGVTNMSSMFLSAKSFNQDIGGWDVSNVRVMRVMFHKATSFNQDLSAWNVSRVVTYDNFAADSNAGFANNLAIQPQWGTPSFGVTATSGSVLSEGTITLTATASGVSESDVTYTWKMISTGGTLSDTGGKSVTFTAPKVTKTTKYIVHVYGTSGGTQSRSARLTITVTDTPTASQVFEIVRNDIENLVQTTTRSQMMSLDKLSQSAVRQGRDRLRAARANGTEARLSSKGSTNDWGGSLKASEGQVDIQATYDDERVNRDGTWVRTVSAELSFEDQKNVGRTRRANIWAQWDHLYRNDMVLGYFVGASIGEQTVNTGAVTGTQSDLGLQIGGYGAREFASGMVLDGYISASTVKNDYDLRTTSMTATSTYQQGFVAAGLALSGELHKNGMKIRPNIALRGVKAFDKTAYFDVRAESSTSQETVTAKGMSLVVVEFAPEFVFDLNKGSLGALDNSTLTLTPSVACSERVEKTTTQSCYAAWKIGFDKAFSDSMALSAQVSSASNKVSQPDQISLRVSSQF